jgi:hypothetical protein
LPELVKQTGLPNHGVADNPYHLTPLCLHLWQQFFQHRQLVLSPRK